MNCEECAQELECPAEAVCWGAEIVLAAVVDQEDIDEIHWNHPDDGHPRDGRDPGDPLRPEVCMRTRATGKHLVPSGGL